MIHNHEVPGSIPGPATKKQPLNKLIFDGCFFVLFRDESKRARFENLGSLIILGGFKYHITNKGKNKPFPGVSQVLLNGRLLQSTAMDCTVHCSRLYGPLQRTIQSAAGDCSNPTDRQA